MRAQQHDEDVEAVAAELGGQDDAAVLPLVLLRQLRLLVRVLLSRRDVTPSIRYHVNTSGLMQYINAVTTARRKRCTCASYSSLLIVQVAVVY